MGYCASHSTGGWLPLCSGAVLYLIYYIYAGAGQWEAQRNAFQQMTAYNRIPGTSYVEVGGHVHEFKIDDTRHETGDEGAGLVPRPGG